MSGGVFNPSREEYDWLGDGFYFFEYAPFRAWQWAELVAKSRGDDPAVIEAQVLLGRCLNLLDIAPMDGLPIAYEEVVQVYHQSGTKLPSNTDKGAHFLDREVINLYCELAEQETATAFQTVRGYFPEGKQIYPGSKMLTLTHVQIAVRDADCISQAKIVPPQSFGKE